MLKDYKKGVFSESQIDSVVKNYMKSVMQELDCRKDEICDDNE